MKKFRIVPEIYMFENFEEFNNEFKLRETDLVLTNEFLYEPFIKPLGIKANYIFQERYGQGEPTDEMIDAISADIENIIFDRIIAFGGGSIIDISKILTLKVPKKSVDLFDGLVPIIKLRKLIAIPTTCGTGSEVTNVAVAELKSKQTKKGLPLEEMFADYAVLIPETIKGLPYNFFVASTFDAMIHSIEAFLSPKSSPYTDLFAVESIKLIMRGFAELVAKGKDHRFNLLKDFALASNYGGIAFGTAGCGAVHAISYALGGSFHVPHGESNYEFLTETLKMYSKKSPEGKISFLNDIFSDSIGCNPNQDLYVSLEDFFNKILRKKPLREYGMTEAQIDEFADSTVQNQQRLLANNYVELSKDEIREIITNLY